MRRVSCGAETHINAFCAQQSDIESLSSYHDLASSYSDAPKHALCGRESVRTLRECALVQCQVASSVWLDLTSCL